MTSPPSIHLPLAISSRVPGRSDNESRWHRAGLAGMLGSIALMGILPFLWTVHDYPLASLQSELVACICLAFALISCGQLEKCEPVVNWPLPALLLALAAGAALQAAFGSLSYPQMAIRFVLFILTMLAAYLLGRRILAIGRGRDVMDWFCAAVLIGGIYSTFVQWLQLFDLEIFPSWAAVVFKDTELQKRPFGNLAQANHLATYLALAMLSALYLGIRALPAWSPPVALFLLSAGIALAGSRMGATFLIVVIALHFAPSALRPSRSSARWLGAAFLSTGYATGLGAVRLTVGQFDTLSRFGQDTFPVRLEMWKEAWRISMQHPLFGIGVGQFPTGQYWVAVAGPYTFPSVNCHNLVLQLAAEFGWLAAIAAVTVGLNWAVRDLRRRLREPVPAMAFFSLLLIAIHSMLEFPLWHLYFAIPAALLFALGESDPSQSKPLAIQRTLPMAGIAMLFVAIAINLDFSGVAEASKPFFLDAKNIRKLQPEDALAVMSVADSRLFRPEVERLLLDLRHPPDEDTVLPLERAGRVLATLPTPEIISRYIVYLAQAGRVDEALVHVGRLRVFASARYAEYRDWILYQTKDLGPQTAPLRHELRQGY